MKMRIGVKILIIVLGVIAVLFLAGVLFLILWPTFGAKASDTDRKNYALRASNFDGSIFHNEHAFQIMESVPKDAPDGVMSHKDSIPKETIPLAQPDISRIPALDQVTVTWFGHSSLLIQMHGMNLLIDPVFSDVPSPVGFGVSPRFSGLPMDIADFPEIDVLLISHDHYDHLDYRTILQLDKKVKRYIVPLGVENHLKRWHVAANKITNMAWWEEITINGLTIGCTPARHFSGRSLNDRFASLWASWVLKDEYHLLYESGDTGFDTHYQTIHDKYGDFDFVMLDGAQYNLRWPSVHQTPEQAFAAIRMLGAKYAMPIHWSTFRLSTHPWDDSVVRLVHAAQHGNTPIITPMIGQTMNLNDVERYQSRWYETVK